jgi:hypothetical protein
VSVNPAGRSGGWTWRPPYIRDTPSATPIGGTTVGISRTVYSLLVVAMELTVELHPPVGISRTVYSLLVVAMELTVELHVHNESAT